MQVTLDLALLRAGLPDLILREGQTLAARVHDRQGKVGVLVIAHHALTAELPEDVRAGDRLRLAVDDLSGDRAVLRIVDQAVPQQSIVPPPAVPLPGGGQVRVTDRETSADAPGDGDEVHAITLRYDAPRLGAVDLRIAIDPETATVRVELPPGPGLDTAQDAAGALRDALMAATGREQASVLVAPRFDPFDAYA